MGLASPGPCWQPGWPGPVLVPASLDAGHEGRPVRPGELEDRAPGARLRVPDTDPARVEAGHLDAIAVVPAVRALPPLDEIGRLRKVGSIPPVMVNPGGTALACFIVSGYHCYLAMA